MTDEVAIQFEADVGIELEAASYARSTLGALPSVRVAVRRVVPDSAAARSGLVRPGMILVSANGATLEDRPTVAAVAAAISDAARPLTLVLRDPDAFSAQLEPGSGAQVAQTTVLPSYPPATAASPQRGPPQVLAVRKARVPEICGEGAKVGDLLEVRYEGRLEDGRLFDGSELSFGEDQGGQQIPGRAGDATLYFVLGMQPNGQFPIAWDAAMPGACVGEVRTVKVPPVLGFQDKGSKRRGVPPYATLFYTLQLVSINGVALPR